MNSKRCRYFGLAGGKLDLLAGEAKVIFKSSPDAPVLYGRNLATKGCLYAASLFDLSLLSYPQTALLEHCKSTRPIGCTVVQNSAPTKLYGSLAVVANSFDVLIKEETAELLTSVLPTLINSFAANNAESSRSPPLSPWDALNYWLHGQFMFQSELVSTVVEMVSLDLHGVPELFSLTLIAQHMDFKASLYLATRLLLFKSIQSNVSIIYLSRQRNRRWILKALTSASTPLCVAVNSGMKEISIT